MHHNATQYPTYSSELLFETQANPASSANHFSHYELSHDIRYDCNYLSTVPGSQTLEKNVKYDATGKSCYFQLMLKKTYTNNILPYVQYPQNKPQNVHYQAVSHMHLPTNHSAGTNSKFSTLWTLQKTTRWFCAVLSIQPKLHHHQTIMCLFSLASFSLQANTFIVLGLGEL